MKAPQRYHPLITPERRAKVALIYPRQSSPAQVRDHEGSFEVQRAQEQIAREFGFNRTHLITMDMGRSSTTTSGRLGWQDVIRRIVAGEVGALFATKVDRLSRVVRDFADLLIICRLHDVILVLEGRVIDTTDPSDVGMVQVQAVFAEMDNSHRVRTLREARLAKARRGDIVSQLPVGWIKRPDGSYDYDPEVRAAIDQVRYVFWQAGSLRQTVRALRLAGHLLPSRRYGLRWKEATLDRVRHFLLHRAYSGRYTFGRTQMASDPTGDKRVQRPVAPENWIVHDDRLPAYMSPEEQERIQRQVRGNDFQARRRPGRGRALCRGLAVCGCCGAHLTVADPGSQEHSFYYQCTVRAANLGEQVCLSLRGQDLDAAIGRAFLAAATAPPLEVLADALAQAESARTARGAAVEAERRRLAYQERLAQERFENVDPKYDLVFEDVAKERQRVMKMRREFEESVAAEESGVASAGTEEELRDLARRVAQDVPLLWAHPAVTFLERKRMLRCLIDQIVVRRTPEAVEATLTWAGGSRTVVRTWRRLGMYHLVRDQHQAGMTVPQIRAWLAEGDPETGQRWHLTTSGIYQILKRLQLRPNPAPRGGAVDRARIRLLYDTGYTLREIAMQLDSEGARTSNGRRWSENSVWHWVGRGDRRIQLELLHRDALAAAKRRRLTNRQAADELNARGVPRVGKRAWTAEAVRQRRAKLRRRARRGAQQGDQVAEIRDAKSVPAGPGGVEVGAAVGVPCASTCTSTSSQN